MFEQGRQGSGVSWRTAALIGLCIGGTFCTPDSSACAAQDGPGTGPLDLGQLFATQETPPASEAETPPAPALEVTSSAPTTPVEPNTSSNDAAAAAADDGVAADFPPLLAPIPSAETDTPPATSRWSDRALPGADTAEQAVTGGVSGDGASEAAEVGAGLAGVLILIWALRAVIRRRQGTGGAGARLLGKGRRPAGVASVLARYPVARGQQVLLLQVGQRVIVTHQGNGTMSTLSEITDPGEVAALHAQISGVERTEDDNRFDAQLSSSLEATPKADPLATVAGLPGLVAETVDLTTKTRGARRRPVAGGVA